MSVLRVLAACCALAVVTAQQTSPNRTSAEPKRVSTVKPAHPSTPQQTVETWMRSMTLREKVAQLVIIPFYGEPLSPGTRAYRQFEHFVRDVRVGGLVIINAAKQGTVRPADPQVMAAFVNRMQRLARLPLIVAGDFERGASMRVSGSAKFPHAMAFGAARDLQASFQEGAATAREARAIGVQWLFAPVADVNNNPENPIIGIRSYGEDPRDVARHVTAFIDGARSNPHAPVLVTVKHFPGHGDTAVDSHLGLGAVTGDRDRLNQVELVPFRAAIAGGVDSVMTAHLTAPAIEPEEIPATVSSKVLTGLLRKELGFNGIIVTDAMDMQGLSQAFPGGEAAVRALEAGADVLLMPPKPDVAVQAVVSAVLKGRLTRKRIDESVARILTAKVKLGLDKSRMVDPQKIDAVMESPEDEQAAQSVAGKAVTLLKNEKKLIPLTQPESACWLVLAERRNSPQGQRLMEELGKRPKAAAKLLDTGATREELDLAVKSAAECRAVYVAAFATVSAYRGEGGLTEDFAGLLNALLAGPAPVAVIALGNPYLLRSFQAISAYLTTYSSAPTSEFAAVKAVFGEIAITGHLPVTIPGVAKIGDGIQLAAMR